MTRRTAAWMAWGPATAVVVISILIMIEGVRRGEFGPDPGAFVNSLVEGRVEVLMAPIFALLAALIISNQPRNIVGWRLMIPALGTATIGPLKSLGSLNRDGPSLLCGSYLMPDVRYDPGLRSGILLLGSTEDWR